MINHGFGVVDAHDTFGRFLDLFWSLPRLMDVIDWVIFENWYVFPVKLEIIMKMIKIWNTFENCNFLAFFVPNIITIWICFTTKFHRIVEGKELGKK